MTKPGLLICFLILLLGLLGGSIGYFYLSVHVGRKQSAELQAQLGTTEEPLDHMIGRIAPGISKFEAQRIPIGYSKMTRYPDGLFDRGSDPVKVSDGPTDCYSYWFGLTPMDAQVRICINYDEAGRVRRAFKDYR